MAGCSHLLAAVLHPPWLPLPSCPCSCPHAPWKRVAKPAHPQPQAFQQLFPSPPGKQQRPPCGPRGPAAPLLPLLLALSAPAHTSLLAGPPSCLRPWSACSLCLQGWSPSREISQAHLTRQCYSLGHNIRPPRLPASDCFPSGHFSKLTEKCICCLADSIPLLEFQPQV